MSDRRGFLKTLLTLPLIAGIAAKFSCEFELPVGCDLSMTSLHEVLRRGDELKLGCPRKLLIGPENIFPAREILGWPRYTADSEINWITSQNLFYEVTGRYPMNTWAVQFDRGVIKSVGP